VDAAPDFHYILGIWRRSRPDRSALLARRPEEHPLKQCPNCRGNLADFVAVCPYCGVSMPVAPIAQQQPAWTGPPQNSGKAIASLVSGLVFFLWPLSAIAAVVLGHIALSDIKKSAGRLTGHGLAVGGLVLGYLGLSILPILIIAAIAIPNLLRSRMAADEASAVASLRTYNTVLMTYSQRCPEQGYPPSLKYLGPGAANIDKCRQADLVDSGLGRELPIKNGYRFYYSPNRYDTAGRVVKYGLAADPVSPGVSGVRHFFTDESGMIRVNLEGSADVHSEPLQ
jgi:type II secretory pathway pseudopilin PulG